MICVYLDQNIYGHMLDEQPADWRKSKVAEILLKVVRAKTAGVWIGPTHVMETAQASDPVRRQQLASMMLELSEASRVWWGHEFEALHEFVRFVEVVAPGGIFLREYLDHRAATMPQIWLGALALLAACPDRDLDAAVKVLTKAKATSRLRHARFAANPDQFVKELIETVSQRKTTTETKDEFEPLTVEQIESETEVLLARATKLGKKSLDRLNKNRDRVARAYGAMEIGELLRTNFTLPMELQLVFSVPGLVAAWPSIQKATRCDPLPEKVRKADPSQLLGLPMFYVVLRALIAAVTNIGLPSTTLSFQIILRDLQKCIHDRRIPTGGLVFDAGHAAALTRVDVFMTADVTLAESLKTMAGTIQPMPGKQRPDIVSNAKQLAEALARRMRAA